MRLGEIMPKKSWGSENLENLSRVGQETGTTHIFYFGLITFDFCVMFITSWYFVTWFTCHVFYLHYALLSSTFFWEIHFLKLKIWCTRGYGRVELWRLHYVRPRLEMTGQNMCRPDILSAVEFGVILSPAKA